MARRYYGRDRTARGKPRPAHLTAWTRASNIAGMHEGVPAASKRPDVSLVELERQLEGALIEYECLCQAWPEESHVLSRARTGGEVEDALVRIDELQYAITASEAKTLPDAAVQLRRLAVLLDVESVPATCLQAALEGQNETAQRLLASALAAVEAADVPRTARQR